MYNFSHHSPLKLCISSTSTKHHSAWPPQYVYTPNGRRDVYDAIPPRNVIAMSRCRQLRPPATSRAIRSSIVRALCATEEDAAARELMHYSDGDALQSPLSRTLLMSPNSLVISQLSRFSQMETASEHTGGTNTHVYKRCLITYIWHNIEFLLLYFVLAILIPFAVFLQILQVDDQKSIILNYAIRNVGMNSYIHPKTYPLKTNKETNKGHHPRR